MLQDGEEGIDGKDATTFYTWIKYANDDKGSGISDSPTDKQYIGIAYNKEDEKESNLATDYTWSLMKGRDGVGISSIDVLYYLSTSPTTQSGSSWTESVPAWREGFYMWSKQRTTLSNGQIKETNPACITGAKGNTGAQGLQGGKGSDGTTYYTWIKYADSPTTGMSDIPTNKKYIGMAYNKASSTMSSSYEDYKWSIFVGPQGVQGTPGINGQTTYTWIKYATSSIGANMSDDPLGKTYIGLAYNKVNASESNNAAEYSWSLIKGDKGDIGESGNGISSIISEYYLSVSKTVQQGGSWITTSPVWTSGMYIWTRSKITYTDKTISYTTPLCDASWEAVNEIEIGGRNLLLKSNYSVRNASYPTQNYYFGEVKPKEGELVTIRMKATLGSGKANFGIYNSGGSVTVVTLLPTDFKDGVASKTCKWKTNNGVSSASNTFISVYPMPNTVNVESTIEWIKLESGNMATAWTPAPEDFDSKLEESTTQITEAYNSAIVIAKEAITTTVSKLEERVGETSKELESTVNSLKITSEDATFAKEKISSLQNSIDGKVDTSKIMEWARFDGASLELGASNSPFKAVLSNTELSFKQGTVKVAWISNNELHIANSVIMEILKVGNWVCRDEGSAGLTWRRV